MQPETLAHHAKQRRLRGAVALQSEAAPADHLQQFVQRTRGEKHAVPAGRKRSRFLSEQIKGLAVAGDLADQKVIVPGKARVVLLHRLVARAVDAPVEVEAVGTVPVELAQRVSEAAALFAARPDADQVQPAGGLQQRLQRGARLGQPVFAVVDAAVHFGGVVEVRVLGQQWQLGAQPFEQHPRLRKVGIEAAAERHGRPALAAVADKVQFQRLLVHVAGLADPVVVKSHEIRGLALVVQQQHLAGSKARAECVTEFAEIGFHY